MKKNIGFLARASILGFGISLALIQAAAAASLTYTNDTTIALSTPAINLTILSGSTASTLTVNTGNIQVSIPAGAVFRVTSASRDLIVTNLGSAVLTQTCSASLVATVSLTTAVDSGVITITPTIGQCIVPNISSPGGGGSGQFIPPPAPATAGSVVHPSGTLVISDGTIYLIQNGQRAGFRDFAEFLSFGYTTSQIVTASIGDLALPAAASVVKAELGTLVLDLADNLTVYIIGPNGSKRGFVSESVFRALGYNFENLLKINLSDYPSGPPVSDATLPHPDGSLVLSGKTVRWIQANTRLGFESEAVFNSYGLSWNRIVPANSADMSLPEGPLVKFRDGTLVFDTNYYIISNGRKLQFSSLSDLTARGYNVTSVIAANLSAYESGGTVQ